MNEGTIIDRDKLVDARQKIDCFLADLPGYLDENYDILGELQDLNREYKNYFTGINKDLFEELVNGVKTLKGNERGLEYVRDYLIRTPIVAYDVAEWCGQDQQFAADYTLYLREGGLTQETGMSLLEYLDAYDSGMLKAPEKVENSTPYTQTGAVLTPHSYRDGNLTDYAKTGSSVTIGATSTQKESLLSTDKEKITPEDSSQPTNDSDISIQALTEDVPSAQETADFLNKSISTNNQINKNQITSKESSKIIEAEEIEVLGEGTSDNSDDIVEEDALDFGSRLIKKNNTVTKSTPVKSHSSVLGIGGGALGIATMSGAGVMAKKYNDKKERNRENTIEESSKQEGEKKQSRIVSIEDIKEMDKNNQVLEESASNEFTGRDFFTDVNN